MQLVDLMQHFCFVRMGANINLDAAQQWLSRHETPGWVDWLQGSLGWDSKQVKDKELYVKYHRSLQEAYDIAMRSLLKKHSEDPIMKSYLAEIFYLNVAEKNKPKMWTKIQANGSLKNAVLKVIPFLQVLERVTSDDSWTSMPPWEDDGNAWRLENVKETAIMLLQDADYGPDLPVPWAHHVPQNDRRKCVVTDETMFELIVGLTTILCNLFLWEPTNIINYHGVDRVLADIKTKFNHHSIPTSIAGRNHHENVIHPRDLSFLPDERSRTLQFSQFLASSSRTKTQAQNQTITTHKEHIGMKPTPHKVSKNSAGSKHSCQRRWHHCKQRGRNNHQQNRQRGQHNNNKETSSTARLAQQKDVAHHEIHPKEGTSNNPISIT